MLVLYNTNTKNNTNTNRKYLLSFLFYPKKLHIAFHGVSFVGYSCRNNRSCRGLKIVQNALEFTRKLFYIVSQSFFMNLAMENPPWITVHLSLLMINKLCTRHENKLSADFFCKPNFGEICKSRIVYFNKG